MWELKAFWWLILLFIVKDLKSDELARNLRVRFLVPRNRHDTGLPSRSSSWAVPTWLFLGSYTSCSRTDVWAEGELSPLHTLLHRYPPPLQGTYFTNRRQRIFSWLVSWFLPTKSLARIETSNLLCYTLQWTHFIEKERKLQEQKYNFSFMCICVCIR